MNCCFHPPRPRRSWIRIRFSVRHPLPWRLLTLFVSLCFAAVFACYLAISFFTALSSDVVGGVKYLPFLIAPFGLLLLWASFHHGLKFSLARQVDGLCLSADGTGAEAAWHWSLGYWFTLRFIFSYLVMVIAVTLLFSLPLFSHSVSRAGIQTALVITCPFALNFCLNRRYASLRLRTHCKETTA